MGKSEIVRISVLFILIGLLNIVIVPHVQDAQNLEQVDLLDQRTMQSINNTIIRSSVTLILQFDFDTDMDGILDIDEPGHESDFDNDVGLPDDPNNPIAPDTGPDGFDQDSDNDGIQDWPWGNDTILIHPITGRSKSPEDMSEIFLIYIDEINETAMLQFSPIDNTCQLDIPELDEGEHVIYVQHIINDGFNTNTTTYEFYIEIQKDTTDQDSIFIIRVFIIVFMLVCIILVLIIIGLYRKKSKKRAEQKGDGFSEGTQRRGGGLE